MTTLGQEWSRIRRNQHGRQRFLDAVLGGQITGKSCKSLQCLPQALSQRLKAQTNGMVSQLLSLEQHLIANNLEGCRRILEWILNSVCESTSTLHQTNGAAFVFLGGQALLVRVLFSNVRPPLPRQATAGGRLSHADIERTSRGPFPNRRGRLPTREEAELHSTLQLMHNEALAILRELCFSTPFFSESLALRHEFLRRLFVLMKCNATFDNAVGLAEEILAVCELTLNLRDIPNFHSLVAGLSSRQLAFFCRVLAMVVFEPEEKSARSGAALEQTGDTGPSEALSRGEEGVVDANHDMLLDIPQILPRLVKLLQVKGVTVRPEFEALEQWSVGDGGEWRPLMGPHLTSAYSYWSDMDEEVAAADEEDAAAVALAGTTLGVLGLDAPSAWELDRGAGGVGWGGGDRSGLADEEPVGALPAGGARAGLAGAQSQSLPVGRQAAHSDALTGTDWSSPSSDTGVSMAAWDDLADHAGRALFLSESLNSPHGRFRYQTNADWTWGEATAGIGEGSSSWQGGGHVPSGGASRATQEAAAASTGGHLQEEQGRQREEGRSPGRGDGSGAFSWQELWRWGGGRTEGRAGGGGENAAGQEGAAARSHGQGGRGTSGSDPWARAEPSGASATGAEGEATGRPRPGLQGAEPSETRSAPRPWPSEQPSLPRAAARPPPPQPLGGGSAAGDPESARAHGWGRLGAAEAGRGARMGEAADVARPSLSTRAPPFGVSEGDPEDALPFPFPADAAALLRLHAALVEQPPGQSLRVLALASHQVEVLFVLSALCGGKRRALVQARLAELGLVGLLAHLFEGLDWAAAQPPDPQPHGIHGHGCSCNPQAALKIQFLRLVHNFCNRDSSSFVHQQPLAPADGITSGDTPPYASWRATSSTPRSLLRAEGVVGEGLMLKIIRVLMGEPADSIYRFWLASCVEAFLRGADPRDQELVASTGLMEHLVEGILKEGFQWASSLQIDFDLLGELIKFSPTMLARLDSLLPSDRFERFVEVLLANMVDSNVFLRSVLLSLEALHAPPPAAPPRPGGFGPVDGEPQRASASGSRSGGFMSTTWYSDYRALLPTGEGQEASCKVAAFVACNFIRLLRDLMCAVRVGEVNQDNICVINTALIFFIFAERNNQLAPCLSALRDLDLDLDLSSQVPADSYPLNLPLTNSGAESGQGRGNAFRTFKAHLDFWQEYYFRGHGRDIASLQYSTDIPFAEWRQIVDLLCTEAESALSVS